MLDKNTHALSMKGNCQGTTSKNIKIHAPRNSNFSLPLPCKIESGRTDQNHGLIQDTFHH